MAVMDILIKAKDQASAVMDKVGKSGGESANWLQENWVKVGAVCAGAAVAIEAVAKAQAPLTEQTQKLAKSLNMTEREIRNLALETTNVTFPLEDVLSLMETGRQQGIKSAEQLQEYATFWDMVGDATGEAGPELGKAGVALRAVGIEAGNEKEALSALGYVYQETTGDISGFLQFVQMTGPELREMGADVNDTAAIMGILEKEFGMTARIARQEFRQAVNKADGDMSKMLETLGISGDTFDKYRKSVDDSSDVIERNADIHAETYTAMDKLKQKASELTYKFGGVIGKLADYAPALMAVGPLMKGVSMAQGAWAAITSGTFLPAIGSAIASVWSFTAALLANPITWIVVGIMALIAAIVLLVKHWDWVKEKALNAFGAFKEWYDNLPGWAKILLSIIAPITLVIANIEKIAETAKNVWSSVANFFGWGRKTVVDEVTELGGEAVGEVVKMSQGIENRLFQLQVTGGKITEEFADEVIAQSTRMKEMAIEQIEAQHEETIQHLEYLRDEAGLITEEQHKEMMEIEERRKNDAIKNQEELTQAVIDKIRELQESGVEVTAEMRAEIEREIFAQRDAVIEAVANQEAEVGVILSKLRHESGQITAEMASEAIKNSIEQRDQTITNAEQQYEDTIRAINAMSDEAIAATGMTRDELIAAAKEQKDETIKAAEELHEGTVKEIFAMNEELEEDIDETTGKILTGWDKFKINFVQGAKDAYHGVIDWFKQLPGNIWNYLVETCNNAIAWEKDMKNAAIETGKSVLNGFIDSVKNLPSELWKILLESAGKLLEVGTELWKNAKKAGERIWEGFKKGVGISSPSYIEKAIDAIAERSKKLPDEMAHDFGKLSELNLPEYSDTNKTSAQEINYNWYGDVIIPVKDLQEFAKIKDFFDRFKIQYRMAGGEA